MNIANPALRRIAAPLLFTALILGCGWGQEEQDPPGVRDEVYVQVMTELLLLDSSPPLGSTPEEREARADSVRAEILASHGVTAHEMLDFARAVGGEAGRMEGLWQSITQKYDSTRVSDLRRDTEARSESEGKLGEEARVGTSAAATPGAGQVNEKANAAEPRDSIRARREFPRSSRDALPRPAKGLPAVRDTTVPPRG